MSDWQEPNPYEVPEPPPGGYAASYGSPTAPTDRHGRPLAEWWKRLVALLIDTFVLAVPIGILFVALMASSGAFDPDSFDPETGTLTRDVSPGPLFLAYGIAFLVPFVYYTVLNGGERGQTLGKMAMRIQVRDEEAGVPIGYGRALVRQLMTAVLGFACGLGTLLDGLFPLWDAKRQALHDKVAKSVVVDAPAST